jgi:parallel beta-helix repeat protein
LFFSRSLLRTSSLAFAILVVGLVAPPPASSQTRGEAELGSGHRVHYLIDAGLRPSAGEPPLWTSERAGDTPPLVRRGSRRYVAGPRVETSDVGVPARVFRTVIAGPSRPGKAMLWSFPVTPGSYHVRLLFAEGGRRPKRAGARVFDVLVEDRLALDDYDIAAEARPRHGISTTLTRRSDALLEVSFVAVKSRPIISGIEVAAAPDPAATADSDSCPGIRLEPSMEVPDIVAEAPLGAAFCFSPGTYRITEPIRPRQGQSFAGISEAILNGSVELKGWERQGPLWKISGQAQESRPHGSCKTGEACRYNEDVYLDDVLMNRVMNLEEVRPGSYFFDYAADAIYVADDPTHRRVEVATTPFAFAGAVGMDDIDIRELTIEKFANPAQKGAIFPNGGESWATRSNEVRFNHGTGISASPEGIVAGNYVHHNGQKGVGAMGSNIIIEGNEIAHNNTAGFNPGWEAGGTKFALTTDLVVRDNYVHHNVGSGLWTDIDNVNTVFEGNYVTDNWGQGIFHEISYDATIRNNVVRRNGFQLGRWLYGAGILVAHSSDVEVARNVVEDNYNGIAGIQQDRGTGRYGPHVLQGLFVHHNFVEMPTGQTGIAGGSPGDNSVYTNGGNSFEDNEYRIGTSKGFSWLRASQTAKRWRAFGNDVTGRFHRL